MKSAEFEGFFDSRCRREGVKKSHRPAANARRKSRERKEFDSDLRNSGREMFIVLVGIAEESNSYCRNRQTSSGDAIARHSFALRFALHGSVKVRLHFPL